MMEKKIESIKQEIRSVLISYKKEISLDEFRKAYRNLLGARLPTREFGFTLDIDFLHSIPDVVHVKVDRNGTVLLYGLADETTEHIQKLVGKQRTVVKGKTNGKFKGPTNFRSSYEVSKSNETTTRCRPFVPAIMRAEIIQVVKQYPDGIGYSAFIRAYQNLFKKPPNLGWLSSNQQERLSQLANAIPELEVKVSAGQEKLHYVDHYNNGKNFSKESDVSGTYTRLQSFKTLEKVVSSESNFLQPQSSSRLSDISTIPDFVKYNIEKILKKYAEGVLAVHFPILYENFTKKSFDLHELGYNCLLDLVDALPDIIIRVESPECGNDWILFHVDFSEIARLEGNKPKSVSSNHMSSSYARKNAISDMAPPVLQYIQSELPEAAKSKFIPVFVSAFLNPSLFWFQLQTDDAIANLKNLEKEMESFYNSQVYGQYRMKDADILIGSSCIAHFPADQHWYRCVIFSLPSVEEVKVLLVDYGSWEKIPRSHLYYLKYNFIRLPVHAFKADLAILKPSDNASTWSINARKRFLELCNKTSIMARINSVQDQTVSVFLCDSSGEEDIHINHVLVLEGYAEICSTNEPDISFPTSSNQQNSVNGSALSHQPKDEQPFMEITPKAHNNIENCHSSDTHLRIENQTSNFRQKKLLINKMKGLQLSRSKKSVRRVLLGDGYSVHIIIVEKEAYLSGEDLCNLFWKGQGSDVLTCRLEFKEVSIPTISISKEKYPDLFTQCERHAVEGFHGVGINYSVLLFPLKYSLKVLNVFGHPSLRVRETLSREIKEFNPLSPVWTKCDENGEHYEESNDESDNNLDRLCLYDLKTMREGLQFKRLKLERNFKETQEESILNKIKSIVSMQTSISRRIEEIETMCLTYQTS